MANRKATFAKRQREMDLKDHAKAKDERRAQRRSQPKENKGPEIAWDEVFQPDSPVPGEVTTPPTPLPDGPTAPAPAPRRLRRFHAVAVADQAELAQERPQVETFVLDPLFEPGAAAPRPRGSAGQAQ